MMARLRRARNAPRIRAAMRKKGTREAPIRISADKSLS
jgi:hypothetical protein